MTDNMLSRIRGFYLDELKDHHTYSWLAEHARDARFARMLRRIAGMEKGHAAFWAGLLEQAGESLPEHRPRWLRLRLLGLLARWLNPGWLVGLLELGESGAAETYREVLDSGALRERDAVRLKHIILDELEHESMFHRASRESGMSNVRDFVLGMNDGLVEILGAVTGLSAAWPGNPLMVAVSGLIVGVAGALSMGIGAFISVRSQRQVNEASKRRLDILFSVAPERATAEFERRLEDAGLPETVTREVAEKIGADGKTLSRLFVSEDDENEWRSAFFTGFAYLFGVAFPVLPYFIADNSFTALWGSILFAGIALASVGGAIALISGISVRGKITEMVLSGFSAAGLAYLFGRLMQLLFGVVP